MASEVRMMAITNIATISSTRLKPSSRPRSRDRLLGRIAFLPRCVDRPPGGHRGRAQPPVATRADAPCCTVGGAEAGQPPPHRCRRALGQQAVLLRPFAAE